MEKATIDHQELVFLRFRDTVKTQTNATADPTFLSQALEIYTEILEEIGGYLSLAESKFQFRTLFLQQSLLNASKTSQTALKNLALSCLFYVLESTHNWVGKIDLEQAIDAGKFQGYFQSQEHQERILYIAATAGNCLEASSPHEFLSALLRPGCRQTAKMIIDLSLCTVQSCNLTAQEIFIGCCMVLAQLKLNGQVSDWMGSSFKLSISKACQLKQALLSSFLPDESAEEGQA